MQSRVARVCTATLLIVAAAAAPAHAQVNYYTQGWFTSSTWPTCNSASPGAGSPSSSTCVTPDYTLRYIAKTADPLGYANGSIVSLGNFALTITGSATVSPGASLFTLAIQQINPTTGAGTVVGSLSGTVMMNDNFSSMIWVPSAQTVAIGSSTYTLIVDANGPAAGRGVAIAANDDVNPTSINAIVTTTTTPEPASLLLVATGLLGIAAGVVRRRRSQAAVARRVVSSTCRTR